jgi:hypothetical protein
MSIEKRKSRRRHVREYARIFFGNGLMTGFCTTLDVSGTGVRLGLNDTTELPNEVTLMFSRDGNV